MHGIYAKQLRYVDLPARINYGRATTCSLDRPAFGPTYFLDSLEGGEGDERLHFSAACRRPGSDAHPSRGGRRVVRNGALFMLCTLLQGRMPHRNEDGAVRRIRATA